MHNNIKAGATPCNMSLPESIYIIFFYKYKLNIGKPQIYTYLIFNFGKLGCPIRWHLRTVAARLTNHSFTSSHDRVVCPTRACLVVTKSPHTGAFARVTPPFTISTLHRFHRTQLPRLPLHDGRALTRAAQEPVHNHPIA